MIGLSPEWDRWFDEAFTELITSDEDLVQAEFDALIGASWGRLPLSPPAASATRSDRPPDESPADGRAADPGPAPDSSANDPNCTKGG
jgi:hypothetical protein